jgi:hypothetical protein
MSLGTLPIGLVAVFLLGQSPSPQVKTDSQLGSGGTAQCHSQGTQKPKPAPPTCVDPKRATCEYRLGMLYLGLHRWDDALQHCSTAIAVDSANPAPAQCYSSAQESIRKERESAVSRGTDLVHSLTDKGAYAAAQDQLNTLKTNESQATAKYGRDEQAAEQIDESTTYLAQAQQHEWPASLHSSLGLREWLPGVVSVIGRIAVLCLTVLILFLILLILRSIYRNLQWMGVSNVRRPIVWSVSSIADSTNQSAAGALIDSLNVYYNPLFQQLYTSSFLAAPPALVPAGTAGDPPSFMWRNFLTDLLGLPADTVRIYVSDLIERIDYPSLARHRFRQVMAYESINLKLGFVDASLGSIVSTFQTWWNRGLPSVTGSVLIEEIGAKKFASVRLTSNFGISRKYKKIPEARNNAGIQGNETGATPNETDTARAGAGFVAPDEDLKPETLRDFFSEERTLSVFASTPIDESVDAVALASQRAAFRLLYRLAKRPGDPGLAVAASSYRQGVRLLNTAL